ncbi:serine hydrolase domain-containing protein [Mycolicibacterium austroafricanum]|uniref:serine hydrolase domain-containing protein n=1 Tax=Mycolicibacterium austroafricanum TaxID=39687 RepID=UPI001CA35C72|nr:beta-lactamase family protein [Mycolicibacterium austroafricanum]
MPSAGAAAHTLGAMITRAMPIVFAAVLALTACGKSVDITQTTDSRNPGVTAPATTMAAEVTDRLDGAVERVMTEAGIPGAIVGIWGPGGDYVRAFGVADTKTRAPMKTDFYSRIGSLTKTFTVTAVLLLADQGRLGLDDPIAGYVDGVPGGEAITLRQLARMQSGLPNYTENPQFVPTVVADPGRAFTPTQLLEFAFSQPPMFAPGEGYHYSNTNTVLLGLVVEKVSGRSLGDYIRDHITAPLGMTETSFPTDATFPRPHAAGYTVQPPDDREMTATDWNLSWAWAAGNMVSTLHDLRIWAPALATGTLLSRQMQQQRLQMVESSGQPAPEEYGLGLFDIAGWIGHNGSVPGYQTVAVYLPERQTALVVLTNSDIAFRDAEPGTLLAKAITTELTPDHVYTVG